MSRKDYLNPPIMNSFTLSSDEDDDTVYESPKPITQGTIKLRRKLEPTLHASLHCRQKLPLSTSRATPSSTSHTTPRTTVADSKKSVAKKTS